MSIIDHIRGGVRRHVFVRYLLTGVFGYSLYVFCLWLFLKVFSWGSIAALAAVQIVFVAITFFMLFRFVFWPGGTTVAYQLNFKSQLIRVISMQLLFRFLDGICNYFLIEKAGMPYWLTPILVTGSIFIIKYFFYRHFVFFAARSETGVHPPRDII